MSSYAMPNFASRMAMPTGTIAMRQPGFQPPTAAPTAVPQQAPMQAPQQTPQPPMDMNAAGARAGMPGTMMPAPVGSPILGGQFNPQQPGQPMPGQPMPPQMPPQNGMPNQFQNDPQNFMRQRMMGMPGMQQSY